MRTRVHVRTRVRTHEGLFVRIVYQLLTLGQVLGPTSCAVDARRVVQPGLTAFVYYYFSMARTLVV